MKYLYPFRLLAWLAAFLFLGPVLAPAAPFTPGNIVVARVGNGAASLSSAATAVFLDEYTPGGKLVQTIELPTAVGSGTNRILTATGNASAELQLTRSADGHYLVLAGYGAAPGTLDVANSLSVDVARVIGRIAADGTVDTSTSTGEAFDGASIRAAATIDGTNFYAVGGSSGVQYEAIGGVEPTQLNAAPASIRSIGAFDGSLYISSSSSPYIGLSRVGTGLPTTGSQSVSLLPGFPGSASGSNSYAFYFADLSASVPGVDVVYLADDRTTAGGGIQKWSLVAGTWILNGTITASATHPLRGLNGTTSGATVSLIASSNSGLFVISDAAGYNAAPSKTSFANPIATAPTKTAFRGLAFAPLIPAPTLISFTPTSGPVGTTVTVTGTDFTTATAVKLNGNAVPSFAVVDAATLTFDVPAGATSGLVAITTRGGTATSTGAFTVTVPSPTPTLTTLAPATAVAGSGAFTLMVNGTGFGANSVVSFNGAALTTTLVSATELTAAVSASAVATAGAYAVTVTNPAPGGGTSAPVSFTVTAPLAPTISSFSPTTGSPGTTVTITGTNFTGATAVRIGTFVITDYTVVSATSITLVLPSDAGGVSGFVTVVTPGGTATSTATFNPVLATATASGHALPGLAIFPNPATDHLTVILPRAGAATVALRDLTGRVVLAPAALGANQQMLLPASLAAGVYLLEVRQGSATAVRRVEKN